jgi:hypothetical protein
VAPGGDDGNRGRDPAEALRTIGRAAGLARAGDTVVVAGGTYRERVRVRASGAPGAPVSFRAATGEKVVLDGDNKALNSAFAATGKHHLRFDGFYFQDFNFFPAQGWIPRYSGEFHFQRCGDIGITRCFSDGRNGYTARFVTAWHVSGLEIENCVTSNKMSGSMYLERCPDLRFANSVIARPMITAFCLRNTDSEPAVMENNIFTDMLDKKAALNINLFTVDNQLGGLRQRNNCYLLRRFPPAERALVGQRTAGDLADYISEALFADPGFAGVPGDDAGFAGDRVMSPAAMDFDFPAFFATSPEVAARGIGLQPEAFADFHFNRGE